VKDKNAAPKVIHPNSNMEKLLDNIQAKDNGKKVDPSATKAEKAEIDAYNTSKAAYEAKVGGLSS